MSEHAASGRIKGAAISQFLIWHQARIGEHSFQSRIATLAPDLSNQLSIGAEALGILASQWYECHLIHGILDALTEGMSNEEKLALTVDGSQAVMSHTLRGVYRSLFEWMANPKRYARHGSKIWSTYYDSGYFAIESCEEDRRAVCTIRDWPSHHPILCDMNRDASSAIYRAMGLPDADCIRETCVSDSANECRFITTW